MIHWDVVRHRVAIHGRVTDGETGKPLAGARVEITAAPAEFSDWLALHAGQFESRWAAMAERPDRRPTAADGHYHFLDLPEGDYTLAVSLPGAGSRYGTATRAVSVSLDTQGRTILVTADVALQPTTVRGRVTELDTLGAAVGVGMAEVRVAGSGESTFSDAAGNYVLSGVETGTRTLRVTASGYQEPSPAPTAVLAGAGTAVTVDVILVAS